MESDLKANTQQQIGLIVLACVVGVLTHLSIHRYGNFLVKQDSALWGVTIGIFLYASQLVLVGRWVKRVGGLTQSTRLMVIGVGFVSLFSALFLGFKEVNRGYPQLTLSMLDDPDEITNQHFTVVSDLNMQRVYTSSGYLGDLKLIPLTDFGHRILLMLSEETEHKRLEATGKLRQDVRLVQKSSDGQVEGPFRQEYRQLMGLSRTETIWFFDTSSRAGLNFLYVPWSLISFLWLIFFVRTDPKEGRITDIKPPPPSRIGR